jgi:pilus assembly protein HofN
MYQVNLLPWRERVQRQRYLFWRRVLVAQLILILLISTAFFAALRYQLAVQRNSLKRLEQQQSELTLRYQQTQQAMKQLAQATARETQRQQNQLHNQRYPQLLQQISSVMPEPLWLVALEENAQGITLQGLSQHHTAILGFAQRLTELPLLQQSRLTDVTRRQDGLLSFTLTARWANHG